METGFMNRITGLVIALVVGGLLVGGLLIPSIEGMTATEKTFENEGYYYMTDLNDQSITYVFDGSTWTINGIQATIDTSELTTIVAANNVIIRANGYLRGSSNINLTSLDITVTADGITGYGMNGSTRHDINLSVAVYYCAVTTPTDYVLSKYNVPTYLNENSQILADGQSAYKSDASAVFRIEGSIADGFTVTPAMSSITITDVVCNYSAVAGYEDLFKVESITFNSVFNNGTPADPSDDITQAQTYSSYVVPVEITAEKTQQLDATQIAMFGVISILGIVALVVVAANGIRNKY